MGWKMGDFLKMITLGGFAWENFDTVENFVENLVFGRFLLVVWLWKSGNGVFGW